jgi:hypothetical protein
MRCRNGKTFFFSVFNKNSYSYKPDLSVNMGMAVMSQDAAQYNKKDHIAI